MSSVDQTRSRIHPVAWLGLAASVLFAFLSWWGVSPSGTDFMDATFGGDAMKEIVVQIGLFVLAIVLDIAAATKGRRSLVIALISLAITISPLVLGIVVFVQAASAFQ